MAAYWHILLPLKLFVRESKTSSESVAKYEQDYLFLNTEHSSVEVPVFKDKTMVFERKTNVYEIDSTVILEELVPFLTDLWILYKELGLDNRLNYRDYEELFKDQAFCQDSLTACLKENTGISSAIETWIKHSETLDYYLHWTSLPSFVVYEGYPLREEGGMEVVSLMRSYFKMDEYRPETFLFYEIEKVIKAKLIKKYRLAHYAFRAGF